MEDDPFFENCSRVSLADKSQILKSGWIRPEDTERYADITHFFKIVGRSQTKSMVIRTVKAYMNQSWDGDLLDILSGSLYNIGMECGAHLDNASLTNVHFFEKITSCDRICETCGYCTKLAGEIVSLKIITRAKLEDMGLGELANQLQSQGQP